MSSRAAETTTVRAASAPAIPSPWVMTELDGANAIFILRGAWLFDRPLDAAALRDGLGQVLSFYPHLAGRMVRGRAVELSNRGVTFTVSFRPSHSVAEVLASPTLAHRWAPRLHPRLVGWGLEPPMKVGLTALRDGTLLNVSCSHACLDGRAFYTFVQSWGRACTGRSFPTPVLDPRLVPPPGERSKQEAVARAVEEGWCKLTFGTLARFVALSALGRLSARGRAGHFSAVALRRLRRAAVLESGCRDIRVFDALAAHLTQMCAKLVGLPQAARRGQVTVLDGRGRLPTLPAAYAANAAFAVKTADFTARATLGEAAALIHHGLEPFVAFPSSRLVANVTLARELVRHRALFLPYDVGAAHASPPTLTYVNNVATLPVYDVDFGAAGEPVAPVRVFPHDLPDPVLIWPAPPTDGGVEVHLAGCYARALAELGPDDPWFAELNRFERAS